MKRILAALVLPSLLGLLALACGGGSESGLPTPGPAGETVIRVEMRNNFFSPSALTVRAGREYLLELRNRDGEAHNLRIAGIDNEYETADDLVSDDVAPGKTGSLELRIDQPGVYHFRSDSDLINMVGTLTVWEAPPIATWVPPTPSPTPSPTVEAESPTPSPTAEAGSPTPSPTAAVESPTPSPTGEAESPTPSPTVAAESPTPSPTVAVESPTPSPTAAVESPTPSPTAEAGSPTPSPTATPAGG